MSWSGIARTIKTRAGTAGTETFTSGASILQIIAVGAVGATVALPDGTGATATIPLPANIVWTLTEHHLSRLLVTPLGLTIVFTGTVSYFVEYVDAPGVG